MTVANQRPRSGFSIASDVRLYREGCSACSCRADCRFDLVGMGSLSVSMRQEIGVARPQKSLISSGPRKPPPAEAGSFDRLGASRRLLLLLPEVESNVQSCAEAGVTGGRPACSAGGSWRAPLFWRSAGSWFARRASRFSSIPGLRDAPPTRLTKKALPPRQREIAA